MLRGPARCSERRCEQGELDVWEGVCGLGVVGGVEGRQHVGERKGARERWAEEGREAWC